MRDKRAKIVIVKNKNIRDCPILVTECFALREAIFMAIQKRIKKLIVQSRSLLVVNSINEKIGVPKDM